MLHVMNFSVAMFMNVHRNVHDSFGASVEAIKPAIALCITFLNSRYLAFL